MTRLHYDFSDGHALSREEVQVLFVLNLPACPGELLIDMDTGARLRGEDIDIIATAHDGPNVTDTGPILVGNSPVLMS